MFTNIVVPLDGSPFSEHALPWACTIATRSGGALRLVHVHVPLRIPTAHEVLGPRVGSALRRMGAETEGREAAYLREVGERVGAEPPAPAVTTALLRGPASASLARDARDAGATLVVIATHARRPLDPARLGSITDALVRRCPVPVLIVHGSDDAPEAGEPGLERVLVPLDGTEKAERVLIQARALARLFGAALTLLRVVRRERQGADDAEAQRYLESVAEPLRLDGVATDIHVARHGDVPEAIVSVAAETGAGLIALSSHCRGGLPRLVLGNVAATLLRLTPTPLLVVGTRTG
jgi:nucleotide-binding universal stress UspA family protein